MGDNGQAESSCNLDRVHTTTKNRPLMWRAIFILIIKKTRLHFILSMIEQTGQVIPPDNLEAKMSIKLTLAFRWGKWKVTISIAL